jgi:nucleoside-diphosphate-sugar epimerase
MSHNTILITGACGYIGSTLIPKLQQREYRCIAVDNLFYNQDVSKVLPTCKDNFYKIDCTSINFPVPSLEGKRLIDLIQESDVVVNLASLVGKTVCDNYPDKAEELNYRFVESLLGVMRPDQYLLNPDSNSSYGRTAPGEVADESYPCTPLSLYADTKLRAGLLVQQRGNAFIPRFATLAGYAPKFRSELLVNDLVRRAYFDKYISVFEPHARRNYMHVQDAADSIIFAIENRLDGIYNTGNDEINCTKLSLCEQIGERLHFSIDIDEVTKDSDQRDYEISSGKLYSTGWRPQYNLDDIVVELMTYFATLPRSSEERDKVIRSMRNA